MVGHNDTLCRHYSLECKCPLIPSFFPSSYLYLYHPFLIYSTRFIPSFLTHTSVHFYLLFSSLSSAPSAAPTDVSVTIETSSSVTFSWFPPPMSLQNGVIVAYSVQLWEMETNNVQLFESTALTFSINSLHPFYKYNLTVAAVTVAKGVASDPTLFQMPEDGKFNTISSDMIMLCVIISHSSKWYPSKCRGHQCGVSTSDHCLASTCNGPT